MDFMEKRGDVLEKKFEPLMTPKEVAEAIGMKLAWTYQALVSGFIPGFVISTGKRRRSIRVRPADLSKWLDRKRISQENIKH